VNVALAQESPKTTEWITVATLNLPVQTQLAQVNPTTTWNTEASLPQNIEDWKNTVKIPIETLISVLESANPPKTVEAAEFIVGLDEETRAMILGKKLPKESLFIKWYEELNTPTSENHLTLLPPLSAVKHIQKWNTLAWELQEYLKDPNINANNIGDISDEILANMGEKNPDLFDQVLAYNEEWVQVSSDLLAYTLEMERITTARADRSEILYKKSVVELEAVNAEKVAVNAEKVAVNAEKVAVNAELVKARWALEWATRLLAALQWLKM
jgi:hypothetical protein